MTTPGLSAPGLTTRAYRLARPLLMRLDPERAHGLALKALRIAPLPAPEPDPPDAAVEVLGLRFPNRVGLAAGFDKDGEAVGPLLRLGFGFVEIGTVTPRPQAGNPRPRLFRLIEDEAVINRFGFNSEGHAAVRARLDRPPAGILGINLGANRDSEDRVADYQAGIRAFGDVASYFTLNVSSPNTPGLRELQRRESLDDLLARVVDAREAAPVRRPLLLKIAPDVSLPELDDVVAVALARGLDGLVVSNTTVARPPLRDGAAAREAGGLSGRPLFELSTRVLAETARRVEGRMPLVGVGGIDSAEAAWAKIAAGATLVQLYSGLVFRGPGLVTEIRRALARQPPAPDQALANVSSKE